ncbi:DNA-binding GntR family transcriptional regulator [Amorphus suaedae]
MVAGNQGRQMRTVAPVERAVPLGEQVYLRLRSMLRARSFEPGERLIDASLAPLLTVSRTPVREALLRLAADGLVETHEGGFTVPRLSVDDVEEIFAIRRLLEPAAVRDVAVSLDADGRKAIAAALAQVEAAAETGDFAAFAGANVDFRAAWLERVPNRRLRETLRRFDDQVALVRRTTLNDAEARRDALLGLRRLADALQANAGPAAAAAMEAFIASALTSFIDHFDATPAFPRDARHAGPAPFPNRSRPRSAGPPDTTAKKKRAP